MENGATYVLWLLWPWCALTELVLQVTWVVRKHRCFQSVPVTSAGHFDCPAKPAGRDTTASKLLFSVTASLNPAIRRANFTPWILVNLCHLIQLWFDRSKTCLVKASRFKRGLSNLSPICCLKTAALKFSEGFMPFLCKEEEAFRSIFPLAAQSSCQPQRKSCFPGETTPR